MIRQFLEILASLMQRPSSQRTVRWRPVNVNRAIDRASFFDEIQRLAEVVRRNADVYVGVRAQARVRVKTCGRPSLHHERLDASGAEILADRQRFLRAD